MMLVLAMFTGPSTNIQPFATDEVVGPNVAAVIVALHKAAGSYFELTLRAT